MYAQTAGCGLHNGSLAPVMCLPQHSRSPARKAAITRKVRASSEATDSQVSTQSRAVGMGLGLALTLGVAAAPALAAPDAFQGLALPGRDGPSVGESLKDAFTSSPPQTASKGKGKGLAAAPRDFIRGRFATSAKVAGGIALLLASSVLAAPAVSSGKANPKAAAKGAKKSSVKKLSSPVQGAKQLAGKARSGGTQPLSKKGQAPKPSFGTQLQRVKSAGTSKLGGTSKVSGKAGAAAKEVQEKAPSGGLVAGLAAAGLVVGGLLFTVITRPDTAPVSEAASPVSQQKTAGSAAPDEEAAAHKSAGSPEDVAGAAQTSQGSTFDLTAGPDIPLPFNSKGNPQQEPTTDQALDARGPAAEAQKDADEALTSKSDEDRIDRST